MKTFYSLVLACLLLSYTSCTKISIQDAMSTEAMKDEHSSGSDGSLNLNCVSANTAGFQNIYGVVGNFYGSSSCIATSDNGIVVCGGFAENQSATIPSALIYKVDVNGTMVWSKTFKYSDSYDNNFYKVKRTLDGGFLVIGTSFISGETQCILLVKLDANGNVLLQKRYNMQAIFTNNQANMDAIETNDGGYAFTCSIQPGTLVDKISHDGTVTWSKVYNIKNDDILAYQIQGYGLLEDNDNLVLTGDFYSVSMGAYLLKLNKNTGTPVFSKTYYDGQIPGSFERFYNIEGKNGNYYISGLRYGGAAFIKLDGNGNVLLAKAMAIINGNAIKEKVTSDGGFVVLSANSGAEGTILYKVNSQFDFEWAQQFQYTNATETEAGADQLPNGSYCFSTVYFDNSPGAINESKILIAKTDQNGNSCFGKKFKTTSTAFSMITGNPTWEVSEGLYGLLAGEPTISPVPNKIKNLCSSGSGGNDDDHHNDK